MNAKEASEKLKLPYSMVLELIATGRLKAEKIKSKWDIPIKDLLAFKQKKRGKNQSPES